jgi:hypothetical protein
MTLGSGPVAALALTQQCKAGAGRNLDASWDYKMAYPLPCPHQTSCLQYLDARNTPLLDHSAPFVARALRIRSSLAVLHLENASLSGRPLMLLGKSVSRRPAAGGVTQDMSWPVTPTTPQPQP